MKSAFLAIALVLASASADAACVVANIAGIWDAYVFGYQRFAAIGRCPGSGAIALVNGIKR
jgi:hypothetical protein